MPAARAGKVTCACLAEKVCGSAARTDFATGEGIHCGDMKPDTGGDGDPDATDSEPENPHAQTGAVEV